MWRSRDSCSRHTRSTEHSYPLLQTDEASPIKIRILYPNNSARFDLRCYVDTHMPLSIELLSAHPGFRGISVERGAGDAIPETNATYIEMCHFLSDSAENFMPAFTPHAAVLQGDMPNYTDIEPVTQIDEPLIRFFGHRFWGQD